MATAIYSRRKEIFCISFNRKVGPLICVLAFVYVRVHSMQVCMCHRVCLLFWKKLNFIFSESPTLSSILVLNLFHRKITIQITLRWPYIYIYKSMCPIRSQYIITKLFHLVRFVNRVVIFHFYFIYMDGLLFTLKAFGFQLCSSTKNKLISAHFEMKY